MKRKLAWRRAGIIGVWAVAVVVAATLYALLCTPGWYELPRIAPESRQSVRNSLVAAEQAFTESLVAGTPFLYHIFADDVNRWIVMRKEIYPLIDELAPPALIDPIVLLDEDGITVAGRCRVAGLLDLVVSVDLEARFESDAIVLRCRSPRCGTLRLPMGLLELPLASEVDERPGKLWPGSPEVKGDLVRGLRIGAKAWWKNGGISYRVKDVQLSRGRLSLLIEPLGREAQKGDQSQR